MLWRPNVLRQRHTVVRQLVKILWRYTTQITPFLENADVDDSPQNSPTRHVLHFPLVNVVEQSVQREIASESIFFCCTEQSFRDPAVRPVHVAHEAYDSRCMKLLYLT